MNKSILAFAAIAAMLTATSAAAGRDELQTIQIRKAIEAKRAAQAAKTANIRENATRWWHPRLGQLIWRS